MLNILLPRAARLVLVYLGAATSTRFCENPNMTAIYKLKPDFRDPRFSQFDFVCDEKSFFGNQHLHADFDGINISKLSWEPHLFGDLWEPQVVTG
ncbi:MAG: hypothetical protein AAGD07_22640 [Planctomycetota bacterium]